MHTARHGAVPPNEHMGTQPVKIAHGVPGTFLGPKYDGGSYHFCGRILELAHLPGPFHSQARRKSGVLHEWRNNRGFFDSEIELYTGVNPCAIGEIEYYTGKNTLFTFDSLVVLTVFNVCCSFVYVSISRSLCHLFSINPLSI